MGLVNSSTRYGIVTKTLHWLVALLFVNQYVVAKVMTAIRGNSRWDSARAAFTIGTNLSAW